MTAGAPITGTTTRRERRRVRRRGRATVGSVLGEILVTLGVVMLLYGAWQLWIGDVLYGASHGAQAQELSREWATAPIEPAPEPEDGEAEPVVLPQPADREVFGNLYVPRWGSDYRVPIAGGVTRAGTLDTIGVGHYLDTEMPGEVGNFGLAAHRTTFGKPFADLQNLRVGDPIVIETEAGWYTYRFRTLEYVQPDEYEVLADVPQAPDVEPGERYITMTSCSPRFSLAERIVAYGVFESFLPRAADAAPPALTEELI
ncbi:class E sortase [Microbacterium marinilacus]|uniref:Class E sortase n=1 Tax=Microbacterium marinilacus TaxID=415209 RepID=A0ABP7BM33_9MICO|nr:class E sortase [Microbacterium marinilacus]MBY0688408.1 class E sortase [Microbacterium marinilacus]